MKLTEDEAEELAKRQSVLDQIYEEKAKGAFIRSRRKWLEQEKAGKKVLTLLHLLYLEKRNVEMSSVDKLNINDNL